MSLGQLATGTTSNQITAIGELIDSIDMKDAVATTDAMGPQKQIGAKITGSGGDYVLALKGDHQKLKAAVAEHFRASYSFTSSRSGSRQSRCGSNCRSGNS